MYYSIIIYHLYIIYVQSIFILPLTPAERHRMQLTSMAFYGSSHLHSSNLRILRWLWRPLRWTSRDRRDSRDMS